MQERGFDRKAEKVKRRRMKEEEFSQDWIRKQSELNLAPEKRFKLALKRRNDEDIQLLLNNYDDFEAFGYRVDRFTFSATEGSEATILVEFPRSEVAISSSQKP